MDISTQTLMSRPVMMNSSMTENKYWKPPKLRRLLTIINLFIINSHEK
jgi:hypothetical protein